MFSKAPHATVRTALATYRGENGFEHDYPNTAYRNVGSEINPVHMAQLCVRAGCGDRPAAWEPQISESVETDMVERIRRELRRAEHMASEPLTFEGPESLNGVPDLAYSGR
ncbi:hypothetical protein ACTWP5_18785 [Streptomyces sp. 4N509B]|uniref:hypothetical protein n=1 Tax=Streptomyces sp. 4N509B TaxID=3457413 RepID=UPI003FD1176F